MWSARSEIVDVYLGGEILAVQPASGIIEVRSVSGDQWQALLRKALDSINATLGGERRTHLRCRFWLGGAVCRLHLLQPIDGVRTLEEAETALSALLSDQSKPVHARLSVWKPARDAGMWLATSIPVGLERDINAVLTSAGAALDDLKPWWELAHDSATPLSNTAMCDNESVSYWRSDVKGNITGAATLRTGKEDQPAVLKRLNISGELYVWRLSFESSTSTGSLPFSVAQLRNKTPPQEGSPEIGVGNTVQSSANQLPYPLRFDLLSRRNKPWLVPLSFSMFLVMSAAAATKLWQRQLEVKAFREEITRLTKSVRTLTRESSTLNPPPSWQATADQDQELLFLTAEQRLSELETCTTEDANVLRFSHDEVKMITSVDLMLSSNSVPSAILQCLNAHAMETPRWKLITIEEQTLTSTSTPNAKRRLTLQFEQDATL